MRVSDVVAALEEIAPPSLAAEWDNVGLLVGDPAARVRRLVLCIDLTGEVLSEAARLRAEMAVAYHPVIFTPVGRLTADGGAAVAYEAARRGVAVYSPHTALDAAPEGTNDRLADVLGLIDRRPLEASVRTGACKVVTFVPAADVARVAAAAFDAGAGRIGDYAECSFAAVGRGTFRARAGARPAVGRPGRKETVEELRLETVCPRARAAEVLAAVRRAHPYEEAAIDVYPLDEYRWGCGLGRVGRLKRPAAPRTLVLRIKRALGVRRVLVAAPPDGAAARVTCAACCAGSCGSTFRAAAAAGATFYLTGEMRHHDALAAAARGLTCVCVGHSHSERLTLKPLGERLARMLPGLTVTRSRRDRDPFEIV